MKNGRAIDRNVVISDGGIEMNKASTVREHKEGEFRAHNHKFNFRYNEFALLVRYTAVNVSQIDGSLWMEFWSNLGARYIDLRRQGWMGGWGEIDQRSYMHNTWQ